MSTVLWTNHLLGGSVRSDAADLPALHAHLDRLDKLCRALGLRPISEFSDTTDLRFNTMEDAKLPEGMSSTDELMAKDGVWLEGAEAVQVLGALLQHLREKRPRIGLLRDARPEIEEELEEALASAKIAAESGAKFNFSVVM
ncbi:MAG: hypothetical protein U1E65_35130 [Myxococcota bacterium]